MIFGPATIVYNGEAYNFRQLRTELEGLGHAFRGHSDTEVLLHSYAEWGLAGSSAWRAYSHSPCGTARAAA